MYHTKTHHPDVIYECSQCDYTTVLAKSLTYHLSTAHHLLRPPASSGANGAVGPSGLNEGNFLEAVPEETYPCPHCTHVTKYKSNLKKHIIRIHPNAQL